MSKQTTIIGVLATLILISGCNMAGQNKIYSPKEVKLPPDAKYILTPKNPDAPQINGAKVFGVRPGSPFLFIVPATGERPITFIADNLPTGLTIDSSSGLITGTLTTPGTYNVTLKAQNARGIAKREFKIVVGDKIALTPPMGWNSWNCWAAQVSDKNVRTSAKAMIDSGLVNHGWTYINIDDTWQGKRDGPFNALQGNQKFPDMKGLCDYVHSLGLKVGVYSSPWITTYAGYPGGSSDEPNGAWVKLADYESSKRLGKYAFDTNDAQQYGQWGIDYLKFDWHTHQEKEIAAMANALKATGRDIIYSLSAGMSFDKAALCAKLANCWRTTGDIRDGWTKKQVHETWAFGVTEIWKEHLKWAPFSGPGHWADADMLVVGKVGWGAPHPTKLTPDEQYTHISLWCLWSSPLLIGCPLDQLDDFTQNLLTNDEVLALNQDPLGKMAKQLPHDGNDRVLVKDLEDGSKAVGLFNTDEGYIAVKVTWQQLDVTGNQTVRDLWRQKNIGTYSEGFEAAVRPHGVILIKVTPAVK
jgi:alpha-galactosidase